MKLAVVGASGRMGQEVIRLAREVGDEVVTSLARMDQASSAEKTALLEADAIIEFATAEGLRSLVDFLEAASGRSPVLVCGSTGLDEGLRDRLNALAGKMTVLWSPNFSPGVFLLGRALRAIHGHPWLKEFSSSLKDLHHAKKRDAPSGTALFLAEKLGGPVAIESIREGETIGIHEIRLEAPFETVEFRHEVQNRDVFAAGALSCARELLKRPAPIPRKLLSLDDLFPYN